MFLFRILSDNVVVYIPADGRSKLHSDASSDAFRCCHILVISVTNT